MTDDQRLRELAARVGDPGERWEALKERVQASAVRRFSDVQEEWLKLMWSLDSHRAAGLAPTRMGKQTDSPARRLEAINKSKGNWFAELLALLLQNRTLLLVGPRQRVQGFSQTHQIDLAWPARKDDPLVCVETKVTGGPSVGATPARGAMDDWSNRRKELKFAATDLKLNRRQQGTKIEHWGVWREAASPKTYFLWAARLRPNTDRITRMAAEAQALVNTYLDGAGIFAWQETNSGYEAVALPPSARNLDLDDVLHRIESEINRQAGPDRKAPPPVTPTERAVEPDRLIPDTP